MSRRFQDIAQSPVGLHRCTSHPPQLVERVQSIRWAFEEVAIILFGVKMGNLHRNVFRRQFQTYTNRMFSFYSPSNHSTFENYLEKTSRLPSIRKAPLLKKIRLADENEDPMTSSRDRFAFGYAQACGSEVRSSGPNLLWHGVSRALTQNASSAQGLSLYAVATG